jgi:hypothetical protein
MFRLSFLSVYTVDLIVSGNALQTTS